MPDERDRYVPKLRNDPVPPLRRKIIQLTHSLNYAAGQLSGIPFNAEKHPGIVLEELIAYGKKACKEYKDA